MLHSLQVHHANPNTFYILLKTPINNVTLPVDRSPNLLSRFHLFSLPLVSCLPHMRLSSPPAFISFLKNPAFVIRTFITRIILCDTVSIPVSYISPVLSVLRTFTLLPLPYPYPLVQKVISYEVPRFAQHLYSSFICTKYAKCMYRPKVTTSPFSSNKLLSSRSSCSAKPLNDFGSNFW